MEEKYMRRCLQLAAYGRGRVAPNPMVGALILHEGEIIGEGFHRSYGEPHAEVNAIASVKDHSLLKNSTMYVNLEPCSHYGQTPPCSKLIIDKKIPRVVVGCQDPYPEVAGRGIKMLKEAGVEVTDNFLRKECEELNKRFFIFQIKKRPYIILKWAQSADGFLDRNRVPGDGQHAMRFSDFFSQTVVHKMRSEEAAIMVGTRTILLDDPMLNVRFWTGKDPLRITFDKGLKISDSSRIFSDSGSTVVFTDETHFSTRKNYMKIDFSRPVLSQLMSELYKLKIQSLIVEGGAHLLSAFIQAKLWDEAQVEVASVSLGEGVQVPDFEGELKTVQKCENSILSVYKNRFIP